MSGVSRIKIFPIYYVGATAPVYRSDCFEPILAGAAAALDRHDMLRDDSGENISGKNLHWAELTAHYWVLKNYLSAHPEEQYLGFCHYRRFPDFDRRWPSKYLPHIGFRKFEKRFAERYAEDRVFPVIDGYDVIVPVRCRMNRAYKSVRDQYYKNHSVPDLERLIAIIRRDYPEMVPDMEEYLDGRISHEWLNFIMRREWFEAYLRWEIDIFEKLERQNDWDGPEYQTYMTQRAPAYLAERFFNVFVRHRMRTLGGRQLVRQCIFLVPDEDLRLGPQIRRYWEFLFG